MNNLIKSKAMVSKIFFVGIFLSHTISAGQSQLALPSYTASVNREVDFVRSLFVDANKDFDNQLCKSLNLDTNQQLDLDFLQITFILSYHRTNDVGPSFAEMVIPHSLKISPNGILRKNNDETSSEIPLNYIRVFNPSQKNLTAQLNIVGVITPNEEPNDRRVFESSYNYLFDGAWKLLKNIHKKQ